MLQVVKSGHVQEVSAITRSVAEELVARRIADYPDDIVVLAKQCVLDFLAVTLAGTRESGAEAVAAELLEESGGTGPATIVGRAKRASMLDAALVNGVAAHALDYDDVSMPMSAHASVVILPALLALAEKRRASGSQVLESFVAGYEAGARIGLFMAPSHYDHGFHGTGTIGTFAAAAACAHLLGLNAEGAERALGIAAAQAAGIRAMFGTDCKPLHAGKGAHGGLFAALLAARGFTSAQAAVECANGFAATHSGAFDAAAALAEPPAGYFLRQNLFKYHAACYMTHAGANAIAAALDANEIGSGAVEKVVLTVDRSLASVCNIASPKSGLEMKFSLSTVATLALLRRDTSALSSFSDASVGDPAVAAARGKVDVVLSDVRPITRTQVQLTLADGRSFEIEHDAGRPETDLALQERKLSGKFDALAGEVLGAARAGELRRAIGSLERQDDIAELMRLTA